MDIIDKLPNPEIVYHAEKHTDDYQPPVSIRDCKALSRDVLLNGERTPFYFGTGNSDTRVNFLFAGVWYHITMCDQLPDVNGDQRNLFPLLRDLNKVFNFVTLG